MKQMKHLKIRVFGRVQGVFFRASTKNKALELGLSGWCRNEPNGSVYIEVEGSDASAQEFITWCQIGPDLASVASVEVNEGEVSGFENFEIRRF